MSTLLLLAAHTLRTGDGIVSKGTRKIGWVGDIKEIADIQRRQGVGVEHTDNPALFGEASVPGTDTALAVRVRARVLSVPEEPDVLLVGDRRGMEEMVINFIIWPQIEEVVGDNMKPG